MTQEKKVVAIIQHPMWLIIREDFRCGEREGDWGMGSILGYAGRVARNIEAIEGNPAAKLNFDCSAVELEDMKAMYPELAERLVAAVKRGQLGFADGTYSQPHLQCLSLETSIRQLEWGVRSIKNNFGYTVRTFAYQDTGLNDQTPQILKAFGFRYAEYNYGVGAQPQQALPGSQITGNEAFYSWTGLDGTSILAVQPQPGVEFHYPDMIEFPDAPLCDFVIVDEYLEKKEQPYRGVSLPRVRVPLNYSYLEGTDAEELSRLNCEAETAIIQFETLAALVKPGKQWMSAQPLLNELWRIWLSAQHHDAFWTGGSELRAKSCAWLKNAMRTASQTALALLMAAFPDSPGGKNSLLCFAVYPKKHKGVMTTPWSAVPPEHFITPDGKKIAAQVVPTGLHKGELFVPFDFAGAGQKEVISQGANPDPGKPQEIKSDWQFQNSYYSATFQRDGSIKTLRTAKGTDVLGRQLPAGKITAAFGEEYQIRNWHIVGPFFSPKKGQVNLDMPTPVEKSFTELGDGLVDLKAEYLAGDETRRWKSVGTEMDGIVDFDKHLGRAEWACAYGYAVLQWPREETVAFKFGSDDGIKVWLNGKVVHVNEVQRSVSIISEIQQTAALKDCVDLPLRKGKNHLLIKIDNCEQGWGFAVSGIFNGQEENFESSIKRSRLWKGPVADILESAGSVGPVPITRRLIIYHNLPWFEMEIECEFNQTRLGDFWDDMRKLVMQWPVGEKTLMRQGIGGGSIVPDGPAKVLGQPGCVILPVNWLDLEQNTSGVTLINYGTLKYFQKDDMLYSILAWGNDTTYFGNRDQRCSVYFPRKIDLRLNGKHTFRFAIYPHDGDWQTAQVPDLAMSLLRPPIGIQRKSDEKPISETLLSVESDLIPTAVFTDGPDLTCRVYEPYGKPQTATVNYHGKKVSPRVCDVAGKATEGIRPWQIANLAVK
jgi:hypothetical protein